jgi:hypothetical protein
MSMPSPNNSFNPTRDSMTFMMLPAAQVEGCSRGRVNSGVRFLLNGVVQNHESVSLNLIAAQDFLCADET